jgi:hypothetical protein
MGKLQESKIRKMEAESVSQRQSPKYSFACAERRIPTEGAEPEPRVNDEKIGHRTDRAPHSAGILNIYC